VAGTFKSGIHDFDAGFVLADIKWLQKHYFADKRVTGYEIRLAGPEKADAFVQLFRARFGDSFLLLTWEQLNADLLEILVHEESTTFAIAAMVILICCINIVGFAILFFVLHEREFGILSLLGCKLSKMRAVLSLISVAAGSVATLMGAGLSVLAMRAMASGRGIPLDPEVYYLDRIPVELQLQWMVGFVGLTIVLCFMASLAASLLILRRRVANLALV
jgi:lipoprotein-releasing system permease protein